MVTDCLVSVILIVSPNDDRVLLWIENEGSPRFVLLDFITPDVCAMSRTWKPRVYDSEKYQADAPTPGTRSIILFYDDSVNRLSKSSWINLKLLTCWKHFTEQIDLKVARNFAALRYKPLLPKTGGQQASANFFLKERHQLTRSDAPLKGHVFSQRWSSSLQGSNVKWNR